MKDVLFFDDDFLELLNEYRKYKLFGIFTNKKRRDMQNKIEYKLFETLEKKIAKNYDIQEILESKENDEKYKNIVNDISYNRYIEMLGETYINKEKNYLLDENQEQTENTEMLFENYVDLPGDEKDFVDGYEKFIEDKNIEYDKIDLKYITKLKRKNNILDLVSYEEYYRHMAQGIDYYDKYNCYVIVSDINDSNRLHIFTNKNGKKDNFENNFFDYKETIETNTYEVSSKFENLSEQDKNFLMELYKKYNIEFSIALKEKKMYIELRVLVSNSINKNIPSYFSFQRLDNEYYKLEKCIQELLEYFLNKFEIE